MSISAVSLGYAAYTQSARQSANPVANDWKTLGSSLNQGNLSGAQTAFNSLQKSLANSSGAPAPNSTVGKALAQLQASLTSGDLSNAQSDFAALKVAVRGGDHYSQAVAAGATSYNSSSGAPAVPTSSSTTGTRFCAFA